MAIETRSQRKTRESKAETVAKPRMFGQSLHPGVGFHLQFRNRQGLRSGRTRTHIAKSRIYNAGNGLFATLPIQKNQFLDEFSSLFPFKSRKEAKYLRTRELAAYCIKFSYDEICDGIKDPRLVPPNGKASFANDGRDQFAANCKYVWITCLEQKVFLQASRDIAIGEEIYVSYGKTYWKYH